MTCIRVSLRGLEEGSKVVGKGHLHNQGDIGPVGI